MEIFPPLSYLLCPHLRSEDTNMDQYIKTEILVYLHNVLVFILI